MQYKEEYSIYSCPQLSQEYKQLRHKLTQEENSRMAMNGINTFISVIGIMSGSGTMMYNVKSKHEIEYGNRLSVIKSLAIETQCRNVNLSDN